jgi:hypothetical protein
MLAGRSRAVRRAEPYRGRMGHHAGGPEGRGSVPRGSPRGANPRRAVTTVGPNGPRGGLSCDGGAPSDRTHRTDRPDPRIGTPASSGSPGPTPRGGCLGSRIETGRYVGSPRRSCNASAAGTGPRTRTEGRYGDPTPRCPACPPRWAATRRSRRHATRRNCHDLLRGIPRREVDPRPSRCPRAAPERRGEASHPRESMEIGELRTPWACVTETRRRVRGGANRQGREKRRRRTEAGAEARDEVPGSRIDADGSATRCNLGWTAGPARRPGPEPGTGKCTPRAGSVSGAREPQERWSGTTDRSFATDPQDWTGGWTRSSRASARSRAVVKARRETTWTTVRRKTPGSTPLGAKDEGGAAKPDERLRRVATRCRPVQRRGGSGRT